MQITGIICEYNPFHLGHLYQMEAARAASGEDAAVVCVMSGNFVQRGEPAVVNKAARAEMAVRCGADLVVELPLPWAMASAERFAAGGVALLEALGADSIAFGSECGQIGRLERLAGALLREETQELIKKELLAGVPYAAARERALEKLLGEDAALLRGPNDNLAAEYLKAATARGASMRPIAVPRAGARHDAGAAEGTASASHIRGMLARGEDPAAWMPGAAAEILRRELAAGRGPVTAESARDALMYRLRTMSEEEFRALPDGGEGLWLRFMRYARTEPTPEAVLAAVKTKRYALARLRRMMFSALLGVTADMRGGTPPYIRVLAIGGRGRQVLRQAKAAAVLPVVTKPAAARRLDDGARAVFELEARAGDLYALLYPAADQRRGGGEWTVSPAVAGVTPSPAASPDSSFPVSPQTPGPPSP